MFTLSHERKMGLLTTVLVMFMCYTLYLLTQQHDDSEYIFQKKALDCYTWLSEYHHRQGNVKKALCFEQKADALQKLIPLS